MRSGRNSARAGAALAVCCALSHALAAAGLAGFFGYPGPLNDPADTALAAMNAQLGALALFMGLAMASAALLFPVTMAIAGAGAGSGRGDAARPGASGVERADGGRGRSRALAYTGLATTTTMIIGWSFWLVGVPALAERASSPGRAVSALAMFDALRVTLGIVCGETIGPLLLACWTMLAAGQVGARIPDPWWPLRPARRAPRAPGRTRFIRVATLVAVWTDWLRTGALRWTRPAVQGGAAVCAALLFLAALSSAGLVPAPRVPTLARLLWSLWLAGVGTAVWITQARSGADRRAASPGRSPLGSRPRSGAHRAMSRPQPSPYAPFRYAAYRAARARVLQRPAAGVPVHGTHAGSGDDAVTLPGDEAIVDAGVHHDISPGPGEVALVADIHREGTTRDGAERDGVVAHPGQDDISDDDPPTDLVILAPDADLATDDPVADGDPAGRESDADTEIVLPPQVREVPPSGDDEPTDPGLPTPG